MAHTETVSHVDGIIPEHTDALFLSQHMAGYAFAKSLIHGKRILEIGFGEGYGANDLASAAKYVMGIDVAPGNATRAAAKYPRPNLTFLYMEAGRLDFPDASFDAACSFQLIEHLAESDVPEHLRQVARVLVPGGSYIITTLNLENAMKSGKPYTQIPCLIKEYTDPELRRALEQVFPSVALYGLYRRWPQHVAGRLKKWGLDRLGPEKLNPVRRYFAQITVNDFIVKPYVTRHATDLFAVCRT